MTTGAWLTAIAAANFAVAAWYLRAGLATTGWRYTAACASTVMLVFSSLAGAWGAAVIAAAELLLLLRDWWNRKGRRAARELGARARAALDGMLERLRESGAPVPQGAPS